MRKISCKWNQNNIERMTKLLGVNVCYGMDGTFTSEKYGFGYKTKGSGGATMHYYFPSLPDKKSK